MPLNILITKKIMMKNDIYNLSMSELVEKYGDDFSEYWVEVGSTSTLEALWEKVE